MQQLRGFWEIKGGREVAELILAFLTPAACYLGFTDDAEMLLWSSPGADPPRHLFTFRLFQIGSAAPYSSDDSHDEASGHQIQVVLGLRNF